MGLRIIIINKANSIVLDLKVYLVTIIKILVDYHLVEECLDHNQPTKTQVASASAQITTITTKALAYSVHNQTIMI